MSGTMMRKAAALVAAATACAGLLPAAGALAQAPQPGAEPVPYTIGYVELSNDPRYDDVIARAQLPTRPLGRPLAGAEVGIADSVQIGSVIGITFGLETASEESVDALAGDIEGWMAEGVNFVIADLPKDELLALSERFAGEDLVILNITAYEDSLRAAECRANVVHVIPSFSMLTDAMVQFLVSMQWRDIMVLQGTLPADAELVAALQRSVQRFGARITEVAPFAFTNDPRQREESNVRLMTSGKRFDVLFLADTDGQFGRYVPYQTEPPRPVVGTAGLVPAAWHWAWERHGAPQLESRFEDAAGRHMDDGDWAASIAVKALVQSVLRGKSTEFEPVRDYLLGDKMNLDGWKGAPMSVRAWDNQFRQPVLLATGNAVIDRAPLTGFLHQTNELDTLGVDGPETQCSF